MNVQYGQSHALARGRHPWLAVSFGVRARAVSALSATVKAAEFGTLLAILAPISALTPLFVDAAGPCAVAGARRRARAAG
jgi:hypothetical protein